MDSLLKTEIVKINIFLQNLKKKKDSVASINIIKQVKYILVKVNKGNNNITELRGTLQRESQK